MLPQHHPNLHHRQRPTPRPRQKALGETPHPAKGVADDAARLLPRKLSPNSPHHAAHPRWSTTMARGTPYHRHGGRADVPTQRARSPPKRTPPPHIATRQRVEVAAAIPPPGAQLDPPFNDPNPTVLAADPLPEPARMPPATGSASSFRDGEEPGGRGKTAHRRPHRTCPH
jgi:hypothetical protein